MITTTYVAYSFRLFKSNLKSLQWIPFQAMGFKSILERHMLSVRWIIYRVQKISSVLNSCNRNLKKKLVSDQLIHQSIHQRSNSTIQKTQRNINVPQGIWRLLQSTYS